MKEAAEESNVPRSLAYALGFLTIGIGALRSVEPFELMLRAAVVAGVSSFCVKLLISVWNASSPKV